ncbi:MAG TPA: T9SS type A sorting domain-containing protein [Candidatus Kapabacteria bacterium]|jgi:hypothetical protein|nr:T9SS type A sorting domain-containing protein [Candidatus Kapabacteria bacterium]
MIDFISRFITPERCIGFTIVFAALAPGLLHAQSYQMHVHVNAGPLDSTYELSQVSLIDFTVDPAAHQELYIINTKGKQDSLEIQKIGAITYRYDTTNSQVLFNMTDGTTDSVAIAGISSITIPSLPAFSGVVSERLPDDGLVQCYPNPTNGSATILVTLRASTKLRVEIYDIAGHLVQDFGERDYLPGSQTLHWDGKNSDGELLPSGSYILRLVNDNGVTSINLALAR